MLKEYPPNVLEKLQEREIELLRVVAQLCEEYKLTYFIDSGTCLGAVRHGGFIPWDDDIDIGMPVKDYVQFLKIASRHLPQGYGLHTCANTQGFTALWAKVYIEGTHFEDSYAEEAGGYQGIFLDVFPYFPLDCNKAYAKWQIREAGFWQKISYIKGFSHPHLPSGMRCRFLVQTGLHALHMILKLLPQKTILRRFYRAAKPRAASNAWYCAPASNQVSLDGDVLFPVQRISFAGVDVYAPADTDAYLTSLYGDYMCLPSEEERHSHVPCNLDFGDGVNLMKVED